MLKGHENINKLCLSEFFSIIKSHEGGVQEALNENMNGGLISLVLNTSHGKTKSTFSKGDE